jgi:BirA family biotin operon repressor/biotin-[acetyl-CoA-carboxylase] ligase
MNFERITPIRFDEIDSTNAEAMRMLKRSKPIEGTCVVANFQSEGRGQRSNAWTSRSGENLLVSFILYPAPILAHEPFVLSKAIAVAVRSAIASFTKGDVQIKWPNDILIDGKKTAGILLENQWAGTTWQAAIAGIGINVNQTEFTPEKATSLAKQNGNVLMIDDVLKELQTRLSIEYTRLCHGNDATLDEEYHQWLFGKDGFNVYQTPEGRVSAKVLRVADDGRMEIITENGDLYRYDLSEMQLIY